ncbi:MAG: cytochrome c biogenesis protein ResB [Syntrophorhabdaceae bacterium]
MTAIKSNKANRGPKARGASGIYRFLVSVRLAVITLSLIAATSIVGSIIRQGATEEEYLASYPEKTYHLIKLLGLDDAYHSTWFYFLIGVFVLNLALCTFQRIRRLKSGTRDKKQDLPDMDVSIASGFGFQADAHNDDQIHRRLLGYRATRISDAAEVFERGHLARYGVLVIHGSILTILAGALIGVISGYKGFLILHPGEEVRSAMSATNENARFTLPFTVKCIDFRVSFYPGGQPKEYTSDVEILNGGVVVRRGSIKVNEPLSYRGIQLYQSSYGKSNAYTFSVDGRNIEIGDEQVARSVKVPFMVARYEPRVHNFGPGVMIAYMDGEEAKTVWFLSDVEKMRSHVLNGSHISLQKIDSRFYTGLEVRRDPGIPLVLAGFGLMLMGLYINFFTFYRRIYVVNEGKQIRVAGYAARNKQALRDEMKKLSGGLA